MWNEISSFIPSEQKVYLMKWKKQFPKVVFFAFLVVWGISMIVLGSSETVVNRSAPAYLLYAGIIVLVIPPLYLLGVKYSTIRKKWK